MKTILNKLYLIRMFKAKEGAILMLSCIISTLFVGCSSNPVLIAIEHEVLKDVTIKDILFPVTIEVIGIGVYILFLLLDFFTGIAAYRKEYYTKNGTYTGNQIDPDKLYKTLWKLLGVLLLTSMLGALTIGTAIMAQSWAYSISIWLHLVILIAANLYEFSSVGDNIKRFSGNKPGIFTFVDSLFTLFKRNAFNRVQSIEVFKT